MRIGLPFGALPGMYLLLGVPVGMMIYDERFWVVVRYVVPVGVGLSACESEESSSWRVIVGEDEDQGY